MEEVEVLQLVGVPCLHNLQLIIFVALDGSNKQLWCISQLLVGCTQQCGTGQATGCFVKFDGKHVVILVNRPIVLYQYSAC